MKAPEFWKDGNGGWKSLLLAPLSAVYAAGASLRRAMTRPVAVGVPVLCVGNVTAGGTGKTPVVIALAATAIELGLRVAVVSRGYGGKLIGPVKVDPARHQAADVGDEPLLIARQAETWIAKDRVAGARAAADNGAELILLDDGFQNPTLHKDLSVIVVDGGFGFGNGCVLPAGPLRETLPGALRRADLILLMGRDTAGVASSLPDNAPIAGALLRPLAEGFPHAGDRYLAFAGIGMPEKFFATAEELGLNVVAKRSFPDHFMYSRQDLDQLFAAAASSQAKLITTAKDHIRLPAELAGRISVLDVIVEFERPDVPIELIKRVIHHG